MNEVPLLNKIRRLEPRMRDVQQLAKWLVLEEKPDTPSKWTVTALNSCLTFSRVEVVAELERHPHDSGVRRKCARLAASADLTHWNTVHASAMESDSNYASKRSTCRKEVQA